jgi:hypothetical protein
MEVMFPPEGLQMLTRIYGITLQKMVFFMFIDVEASNTSITLIEENKSTFSHKLSDIQRWKPVMNNVQRFENKVLSSGKLQHTA